MRYTSNLLASGLTIAVCLWVPGRASAQDYPPAVSHLVATAKAQIKTIDMATFKAALDKNAVGLLIDVREPGEYADGFIPGAINVPRGVIELRIWTYVGFPDKTDMSKKITLYCGSGTRCVLTAKSLQDLGFSDVTAVDMRLDEWANAGNPFTKR